MRRNASWPVWPPAPVTATRLGAAAAASAAAEARSHRCIAACLCSRVVLPEQLASAHFRTLTASWLPVHRCGDVMRSLGRAYTRLGAPVRRVKGKTRGHRSQLASVLPTLAAKSSSGFGPRRLLIGVGGVLDAARSRQIRLAADGEVVLVRRIFCVN